MPATLEKLTRVRSRLVEELVGYLNGLAERAAELPRYYPEHLRTDETGKTHFDDIRQMVQVIEDRSAFERWRAEERERMRAAGQDFDDRRAYDPTRARPESEEQEREYRDCPEPPPPIPWDERAGERFKRAVILGDPGFGKTWLLRYEARRIASEAGRQLREHTIGLDDLTLPIFAWLSDVNRSDEPIEDTLVELIGTGRSDAFRCFVRKKLATSLCVVLLDAWDEARPRQRLGQRLEAFARRFPQPHLLMTSRIVGYDANRPPIPNAKELELLAFEMPQTESFVRVWFGDDTETVNRFLAMLRQNNQVRGLARIPLMLALMCRAYQEKQLDFPTRRVELYDRCLRGLLRDWKIDDAKPDEEDEVRISTAYVDAVLELLQSVGYNLFVEGHEQFKESLLRAKMRTWLKCLTHEHELYGRNAASLIAELKRDGILITAGEHRDAPLLFLHRTFHEYLTVCALSQQKDWLDVALAHVYHPEWQEVLRLLGGVLDDRAVEYVAALLHENKNDLLCRPFRLAVIAAAETHPAHLPDGFSDKLLELIIELYMNQPKWLYPEEIHRLVISWGEKATCQLLSLLRNENPFVRLEAMQAFSQIGTAKVLPHLVPLCKDVTWGVRYKVAETLGKIGTSEVIQYLLLLLKDVTPDVCYVVVKALGQMRASEAIPDLLPLLLETNAGNPHLSKAAAMALGRIGAETLPHLLSWLEDANWRSQQLFFKYWNVYEAVARTLGQIGAEEVVPHLLTLLKDVSYKYVRRAVSEALGLVGTKAVPHLLPLLKDADLSIRYAVVEALGRIGTSEVIPHLLPLIRDADSSIRYSVIEVLGQIGTSEVVPHFLPLLKDTDVSVCCAAAEALGLMRAPEAIPYLLPLLKDADSSVRYSVVKALGQIGTSEAVPYLLPLLKNTDVSVCCAAAAALGRISNPDAIPDLLSLLGDTRLSVRCVAVETIGQIGASNVIPSLLPLLGDAELSIRYAVTQALAQIGPEAVPHLLSLLNHQDALICEAVAKTLGQIGASEAVTPLVSMLEHQNSLISEAAAEALGRIGAFEAVPYLLPLLGEGNVAQVEVQAIRQIGQRQKRAIPVIGSPSHVQVWMQSLTRSLKLLVRKYLMIANY